MRSKEAGSGIDWLAMADAGEAAAASKDPWLPGPVLAALICASLGVAPGDLRDAPPDELAPNHPRVEVLDALGRVVWSDYWNGRPDVYVTEAIEFLETLLPGWKYAVSEDDDVDYSAEAELYELGKPDCAVQGSGSTMAVALMVAACRAMAHIEMRSSVTLQEPT